MLPYTNQFFLCVPSQCSHSDALPIYPNFTSSADHQHSFGHRTYYTFIFSIQNLYYEALLPRLYQFDHQRYAVSCNKTFIVGRLIIIFAFI